MIPDEKQRREPGFSGEKLNQCARVFVSAFGMFIFAIA